MSNIIIDPTVLGDRLPRDKDSLAQMKEKIQHHRDKEHRSAEQPILTNQEASAVNYIQPMDFIRRLKKLNDGLLFGHGGIPGHVSVWVVALDDEVGSPTYGRLTEVPIACGFPIMKPLPEFSWVGTDDWGIATKEEERGWRTVLMRLIKGGFLKYSAVKAEFGEPHGSRGVLWHKQLQPFKI